MRLGPGLYFDERGRFGVGFRFGIWNQSTYDLNPDRRPASDLVGLCQLYAGHRLDRTDGLVPLRRHELQSLWTSLRAKYPGDFAVSPQAAAESRLVRLDSEVDEKSPAEVAFLRRWLAKELMESGWRPGEPGNESRRRSSYIQCLLALAEYGRHVEATDGADALLPHWPKDNYVPYACGCVYSLAAKAVKDDATLNERYGARAVATFRQAITAGYKVDPKFGENPDFDALRPREDFRELEMRVGMPH